MSMEKMREQQQRKKTQREYLQLALAMAGVLQSTTPATNKPPTKEIAAQEHVVPAPRALPRHEPIPLPRMDKESQPQITAAQWFERRLHIKAIDTADFAQMEDMILNEKIDLSLQLKFLRYAFRPDGPYMKAFEDPYLDPTIFSKIIHEVDAVSTRLTQAYGKQVIQGFEYLFSSTLKTLQNSSRILNKTGRAYCNGGLYRDSVGKLRFETDGHCEDAVHPDMRPYLTLARGADAATMLVTPEMYSHLGIKDDQNLPVLDPSLTVDQIVGQPVVSYSYGPKMDLKVHYSIAMPWTAPARKIAFNDPYIDQKDSSLKDMLFMIKPPEESKALEYDKEGKVIRVGASGSSGSLVALPGKDGLRVVGTFVSVKILNDQCRNVCYSLSNFNTPATHEALAQKDRSEKGLAMRH